MKFVPTTDNGRIEITLNTNNNNEMEYIGIKVSNNIVFIQAHEIKQLIEVLQFMDNEKEFKKAKKT